MCEDQQKTYDAIFILFFFFKNYSFIFNHGVGGAIPMDAKGIKSPGVHTRGCKLPKMM